MDFKRADKHDKRILILFCAIGLLFAMLSSLNSNIPQASFNAGHNGTAQYLPIEVSIVDIEFRLENSSLAGQRLLSRIGLNRTTSIVERGFKFLPVSPVYAFFSVAAFLLFILSDSFNLTQKSTIRYIHNTDGMK